VRRALIAALLLVALGVCAARANQKPTDRQREAISSALDRAGFSCDLFTGRCHRRIRVSTVNERWAAGYIRGGSTVQGADASLKRKNHRWRVKQIGNGGGCSASEAVRRDLHLGCY
jgi:hypothetical protein